MICITVTPQSRRLAKADLLNAARFGDIVELCLDHLHKEPDVKDLISGIGKPVIISCRRRQDGGQWEGDEEQRLLLLRQAIVAGPDYIELDLDVAPKVPRFGNTKRVISFTRLDRPETDIDSIFDAAAEAKADVVKFCWPTPTLDAAWPLLAAVSQKRQLPVVGMGLGRPELTFSLLGLKYGSPWVYAALEQGMEAHAGQANVFELNETYHVREINSKTAFVGIAGFGETQTKITRIFNAAFQMLNLNVRCLPLELGDMKQLKKMLDVLKIRAIVVEGEHGQSLIPLADHMDPQDAQSQYVNLLLKRDDGWHGYNTLWRTSLKTLEKTLSDNQRQLERQNILVIGTSGIAQSILHALSQKKAVVSVCGLNDRESQRIAQQHQCRFVPFQNLYETLTDVLIIADRNIESGTKHGQVNPSVIRENMLVLDVSQLPLETSLMSEGRQRGCTVIPSHEIFEEQIKAQFKAMTGQELPEQAIAQGLAE